MSTYSIRKIAFGGAAALSLTLAGAAFAQDDYPPGDDAQPAYDAPTYDQAPQYDSRDRDRDTRAYRSDDATRFGDVIVRAPRRPERDSATGAPIETVAASREVRYDDLDLNSRWGAHELRVRIDRAARDACDELDRQYTVINSDDSSCVRSAVRDALYQTPIADDDDD